MKSFLLNAVIAASCLIAACNNSGDNTASTNNTEAAALPTADARPYTQPTGVDAKVSASLKPVIDGYLKLKNALAADDSQDAAIAGQNIVDALTGVNTEAMSAKQKQVFIGLVNDLRKQAENTIVNAGNITRQREHFEMLTKDVHDLAKTFGGGQKLYYTHCPMAFDGKGANWLSEAKKIRNPYLGNKMLECGEVKEDIW